MYSTRCAMSSGPMRVKSYRWQRERMVAGTFWISVVARMKMRIRRLFQRLQQGVEGRCGQHVHLIDDVYLIMAGAGGIGCLVPQVADVVHAVVGGSVHFHHIEDAAVVDAFADLALAAGVAILGMEAVDRLGKDLGAGGLARAAHACKQVGVANAPGGHLVAQRGHRAVLGHHILKPLGSPLAVQRAIHPALLL